MSIPGPILVACFGLIVMFTVLAAQMLRGASKAYGAIRQMQKALGANPGIPPFERRNGLKQAQLGALRSRCSLLQEPMRTWWFRLEDNLEKYTTIDQEGWFLTTPPREILPEESVTERFYHSSFYQSVPGILTGLGLLATFVAILIALTGLHVTVANNTETVTGIKELIEGLSGKFLSSIVGLLLSMMFLIAERKWCERRLTNAYETLLDTVSQLLPTITATRVHLDIQLMVKGNTLAVQSIAADISKLKDMVSVANLAVPEMASTLEKEVISFSEKVSSLSDLLDRSIKQLQ